MKKTLLAVAVISILAAGAMAFAHGPGGGSGYGGHMMGPGYGGHMMGSGYGGHMMGPGYGGHMMGSGHMKGPMMGWADADDETVKKFLDETADLRKQMHDKKFEYLEARRNPDANAESLKKIEKEMYDLKWQIREKAPTKDFGTAGGYGCW
jgi:hypothetical protein